MPATIEIDKPENVHVTTPSVDEQSKWDCLKKSEIKIAYIGGGSREWAVKLMSDLALSSRITGRLDLFDIDFAAASENQQLSEEVFAHRDAKTSFKVRAVPKLEDALKDSDFVVISIEPGPITMRRADLEIPARHGILQTVGDTTGPGGILRGLRSIPILRHFARAIIEHCPGAWVINYTNPMALCTAALYAEAPAIKAFGCCHEVFGTQTMLAKLAADHFKAPVPDRREVHLEISGINHFTWALSAEWKGEDLLSIIRERVSREDFFRDRTQEALKAKSKEQWFEHHGLIAYDLFRRFGVLGAAGDRHLAEFVPWYLRTEEELHRWGVIATPYSWRVQRLQNTSRRQFFNGGQLTASGEEGVAQIEAILGLGDLVTNVNLPNRGQLPDLEKGIVVETNALISRNQISPLCARAHPPGSAELLKRAASEQRLTMEASLRRDFDLALQAIMLHPLVVLNANEAGKMFQEMVTSTISMLPGWQANS